MTDTPDYQLRRNAFGKLELISSDDEIHAGVVPVRAFPISAPADGIALVDPYGHELAWIDELGELPEELRTLLESELAQREFMPVITRIVSVASFATPSTWQVETDRGAATLILKGEEDIRRLTPPALLIADSHGIHFLIPDRSALDQHSRRILDRFL
ncbi:MAG: DUF1854 domain-containing protein [Candidatus Accumulibacter phosphatis]|jgi:hypothetical protein|uniref:DUF1854 domain-containing protein n=2 Tax=Candidatus Accumulibacter TaxID=327159 RepID=A0A080LVB1_9PROT|nr:MULTISPECIES: DUF1854 domain-containing protein [Candidatus Accumulibacter]KFB72572.1 MAG: hypothetical protein AW09_002236 [Candidatus Accumulibacter phosphatis]MBL8408552.1 DUF1854 domain-containing protein [Accumulibacter sp.]NMQ05775.1 DUF1854 domain-containing protein [Candidatus Accumulibacter contiguus]HRF10714.1 DUF1854 domain-containing protein [Candidatus Accumulibacter phosphatis]